MNRSRSLSDGTSYSTTRTTGHKVSVEAGTEGAKTSMKAGYEYSTSKSKRSASSPIAQPPHIIVNQKQYSFRRAGDVAQFKLLCSGHWVATSDQDWCQVSPSSGESTGGDERDIFINVEAFEQDGTLATRIGHISLKDTTTGQTQTLWITQANK